MRGVTHRIIAIAVVLAFVTALPGPACAQDTVAAGDALTSEVRVVRDRATIWTRNPSLVLAVAPAGTVLKALSRDDKWYEVDVPETLAGRPGGARGFILAAHVELVAGTPPPPTRGGSAEQSNWEPVGPGSTGAVTRSRPALTPPALGIRGFGVVDYQFFTAQDSFDAILGGSSFPLFGGGVEVVFGGRFFANASATRFKKTGERVFVSGGEVFKLGIDDTVTITPIQFTAGYRLRSTDRLVPYVGGGAGIYKFKEESEFAEPGDNVDDSFASYHALAGVEYVASKWLFTSFEVQYTTVPDSLGAPGVSAAFDEKNLGGLSLRLKVSLGR